MSLLGIFNRAGKSGAAASSGKSRLVGSAAAAALLAASATYVAGWEGVKTEAYLDRIASPPVWTVCAGETRGVKAGDRYTRAECVEMLGNGLVEFETGMRKCLTAPDALPDKVYTAFLSVSWNIGTGGFCKSSMARLANAGDLRGACDALLKWDRAGGRRVPGLTRRRHDERKLCLEGIAAS